MTAVYHPGERRSALLLCLMGLDLLCLPMFHLGPVPWKPSYLLLLFYLPRMRLTAYHRAYARPALLLAFLMWPALLTFWFYNDIQFTRERTLTFSFGFLLGTAGFALGFARKNRHLDFITYLNVFYTAINAYLWLNFDTVPDLIRFYGLEERLEEGLMAYRNMGVLFNPNVSAMSSLLLIVFYVIAYERGALARRSMAWVVANFVCVWATVLSFGSRGTLVALALLTVYFFQKFVFSRNFLKLGVLLIIALVLSKSLYDYDPLFAKRADIALASVEGFKHVLDIDSQPATETVVRPVRKLGLALERLAYSPLWGTGMETNAENHPFEDAAFHNDALSLLAGEGILGFVAYLGLIGVAYRISPVTFLLFLKGMVHSFVILVSHFLFFSIMMGYFYGQQHRYENLIERSKKEIVE